MGWALLLGHYCSNTVFKRAQQARRGYHAGHLTLEQLQTQRLISEADLADTIDHPPKSGWATDTQALANRFYRHWSDWFMFLGIPEVKPDNDDATSGQECSD